MWFNLKCLSIYLLIKVFALLPPKRQISALYLPYFIVAVAAAVATSKLSFTPITLYL